MYKKYMIFVCDKLALLSPPPPNERLRSNIQNWRDARASFVLPDNSSTIKRLSANPWLDADLHLNPPGGILSGTDRATAFGGWFYFRDLFVRTRGRGYKINFEAFVATELWDFTGESKTVTSSSDSSSRSSSSSGGGGESSRGVSLKASTMFEVS